MNSVNLTGWRLWTLLYRITSFASRFTKGALGFAIEGMFETHETTQQRIIPAVRISRLLLQQPVEQPLGFDGRRGGRFVQEPDGPQPRGGNPDQARRDRHATRRHVVQPRCHVFPPG